MISKCAQCGCEFKPSKPTVRFCSHNCHDVSRERLSAEKIRRLALAGESKEEMARQLGVSLSTVRRAVVKYGFQADWQTLRWI